MVDDKIAAPHALIGRLQERIDRRDKEVSRLRDDLTRLRDENSEQEREIERLRGRLDA